MSLAEKLRDMNRLAAGSCDPEFNRALLDAADEIERLQAEGIRFADWIDGLYSSLPNDRPPGPPRQLLKEMRDAFQQEADDPS